MDIAYFREFIELMSQRSARRAARALNISPSTLSHHMRALEQELGVQLLEHGNKTEFTPEAHSMTPAIIDLLKAYDAVCKAAPRANDAESQPFRVFCAEFDQLCSEVLSFALEELRRDRDIRVVEVVDVGDSLHDALLEGEIDAVLGLPVQDGAGRLEHHEVIQDRLVAWFDKDSDLADAVRADGTIPGAALAGHVLPITVDPRLRRNTQSLVEALLNMDIGIGTVPALVNSQREYVQHIHDDRFCVTGTTNPPFIPLALNGRFMSAVVDSEDVNADRVLTLRAGDRSVAALRTIEAMKRAGDKVASIGLR